MVFKKKLVFIFISWLFMMPTLVHADYTPDIITAYIHNLIKYVSWPIEAFPESGKIQACYFGKKNDLSQSLAKLEGKSINDRIIEVINTTRTDRLKNCQIIFYPDDSDSESMQKTDAPNALLISQKDTSENMASIILFNDGKNIRFKLNLDTFRERGLKISANVIRLATSVKGRQ